MKNKYGFIPYSTQEITDEDIDEVKRVLKSKFLTQGPAVETFENLICKKVNAKYGIAVNSGTSALHIACLSLNLGNEDIVWTTPNTFLASANCARYCGAKVDFVDIDLKTGLMCLNALKAKLEKASSLGRLPKVLIPVHLSGNSCKMEDFFKLSKKYGFKIIEDASHAVGSKYKGEPVGCCKYSDITVFSFHPVKIITTGEGGIAVTNNAALAQSMKDFSSHGVVRDSKRFKRKPDGPWIYEQQKLGFNYRMTDIQAALGSSQIKRLEKIVIERNNLFNYYHDSFHGTAIKLLETPKDVYSSRHLGIIYLSDKTSEEHKKIFKNLKLRNIGVQLHYSPVHLHPYYRNIGFKHGDFPNSELYAKKAMSIPLYPGLTKEMQNYIISSLNYEIENV